MFRHRRRLRGKHVRRGSMAAIRTQLRRSQIFVPITVMIEMYDYLKASVLGGGCHAIIRPDHPGSEDI
jgi:hypothetical protein